MAPRITPLRTPITFAHRGARAHERENTIAAFQTALRWGVTGLESDVWTTRDGVPILDHDGVVGSVLRRRSIGSVDRADLPPHIPSLAELYASCGADYELSLDIKDANAAQATAEAIDVASASMGLDLAPRTWFCHPDFETVARWKQQWPAIKMVHSTRLHRLKDGPERHAARLNEAGIEVLNMRQPDWTGGLATLFHRFEILCFCWDVQLDRLLAESFDMGVDAIYSDPVDRLVAAFNAAFADGPTDPAR